MRRLLAFLCLLWATPTPASYEVGFYAHELGNSFPHALYTVKGRPDTGGPEVDANYGFTAKTLSPAILMGPVYGIIESETPGYVRGSKRHFTITIDDAGYARLMAVTDEWRRRPGKSYSLAKANCVHFIGEAARAVGLTVDFPPKLMRKPRSYLLHLIDVNPQLKGTA